MQVPPAKSSTTAAHVATWWNLHPDSPEMFVHLGSVAFGLGAEIALATRSMRPTKRLMTPILNRMLEGFILC